MSEFNDTTITQLWETLHAMPEPAFHEFKTSAFLAQELVKAGFSVQTNVGGTGVIGVLDSGHPGPVVGLRSDMDCLLFKQDDGSQKPIHACGHDGHMAIVLTTAQRLAKQGIKYGKLKIIFQPAEEIGAGAKALLDEGVLDDVDFLFGLHLMPKSMAHLGEVIPCVRWTACHLLTASIEGRAAHGSRPHEGINAIDVGATIISAVNAIHMDPLSGWSVKPTRFIAGASSVNTICDKAEVSFDLRSLSNKDMLVLVAKVSNIIETTAQMYGAKAKVEIIGTCPASVINEEMLALTKEAIVAELDSGAVLPNKTTTVGEDFNFYPLEKPNIKTAFFGLGANLVPGLHDPNMYFDHKALMLGSNILLRMVNQTLKL